MEATRQFSSITMTTQISNLINGDKNVRRDLTHSKYVNAKRGSSSDFAGTSFDDRKAVADKVKAEHPGDMSVGILGRRFDLVRYQSASGKTVMWAADITEEDYTLITGYANVITTYQSKFSFQIGDDMKCRVHTFARKSDKGQWRERGWDNIGEEFINIL